MEMRIYTGFSILHISHLKLLWQKSLVTRAMVANRLAEQLLSDC